MKVACEKKILEEAVQVASRAINSRSPLPILSHILMEAHGDQMVFTATDADLGVQIRLPAQVEIEGALTCPAKLLQEIVTRLQAGLVHLELIREGQLMLKCGSSQFELSTLPAEEFPTLPSAEDAPEFELPQATIREMIRQVAVASASPNEEARAVMTGILTQVEAERLTMVATDGRRLACMREPLENQGGRDAKVIIPARALQELTRILGDEQTVVLARIAQGQVFFTVNDVSLHCRLLEGNFPNYKKVVPTEFERSCRIGRETFLSALKRMLIMAQEKRSPNLIKLEFESDHLWLSANTPDLGSGREQVDIVYQGDPLLIAFNGRYLVDVLNVLECEEVQFDLQEETRSAVIKPFGSEAYDYVVMPVKLREPVTESGERVAVGA